jgi:hypothetical protein
MPRPKKAAPEAHGAKKKQFQFMLTEEASDLVDRVADELGITRSEVLERVIRNGGLQAAKSYELEIA